VIALSDDALARVMIAATRVGPTEIDDWLQGWRSTWSAATTPSSADGATASAKPLGKPVGSSPATCWPSRPCYSAKTC
jgi:hypothetical protein